MSFLAPISFWFLCAIPLLLLFYFFKKQYDKQPISSIYLWERTMNEWETDRWWRKLQKNLLLLLQLLILLFLIVALTRPFMDGKEVRGDHLVIILDSSATMTVQENGETRFSLAKKRAQELIDQLDKGHSVSVIHAQKTPVLLTSNENNLSYSSNMIEDMEVSYQHENLTDSIQLAQSLIDRGNGEIHIFTDNLEKESLEDVSISNRIVVHNIESTHPNRSVKMFGVKQQEEQVSAIVTVENQTDEPEDISISISASEGVLEEVSEMLPPNSEQTITIEDLPIRDYYKAAIGADDYKLDNVMYTLLPKQQASSIYQAGEINPFIDKALRSAGIEVITVPQDDNGSYLFPEEEQDAIYILAGIDSDLWPEGPKLIISPSEGGPFEIKEKVDLDYAMNPTADDPMLHYTDVTNVYLGKAYGVGNWNGLKPLVTSGEQTIMAKGNYGNAPMILFPFDLEDSDWPLHPSFPILLTNSVAFLAENGQQLGYYEPVESVNMKLSLATEEAVIETLDGDNLQSIDLNESVVTVPNRPGIYQLHEQTPYGSVFRYFIVQLNNQERTAEATASFSLDVEGQQADGMKISKQELWRWFAAIALLILYIEWEVYRRGISSR